MATIIGGANDGYCGTALGTWANTRNSAGDLYDSNNTGDIQAVYHLFAARRGTWLLRRAFFEFDTSGLIIVEILLQ